MRATGARVLAFALVALLSIPFYCPAYEPEEPHRLDRGGRQEQPARQRKDPTMQQILDFCTRPEAMTSAGGSATLLDRLPRDVAALPSVVQGLRVSSGYP